MLINSIVKCEDVIFLFSNSCNMYNIINIRSVLFFEVEFRCIILLYPLISVLFSIVL